MVNIIRQFNKIHQNNSHKTYCTSESVPLPFIILKFYILKKSSIAHHGNKNVCVCLTQWRAKRLTASFLMSHVRPHAVWCLGLFHPAQTLSPLPLNLLCPRRELAGWHPSGLCLPPTTSDHVLHFIYLMLCSSARPRPEAKAQTDMHLKGSIPWDSSRQLILFAFWQGGFNFTWQHRFAQVFSLDLCLVWPITTIWSQLPQLTTDRPADSKSNLTHVDVSENRNVL